MMSTQYRFLEISSIDAPATWKGWELLGAFPELRGTCPLLCRPRLGLHSILLVWVHYFACYTTVLVVVRLAVAVLVVFTFFAFPASIHSTSVRHSALLQLFKRDRLASVIAGHFHECKAFPISGCTCYARTILRVARTTPATRPRTTTVLHDTAAGQQRGFQGSVHERHPVHGGQVAAGPFIHIPGRLPLRRILLRHQERVGLVLD